VYLVLLTLLIATPLGVGAAIYLIEYAGEQGLTSPVMRVLISIANFAVETLAGIPSIIYGLFGYALFVSTLRFGWSLLSASLAGACLVLPTIIRTTEEALLTVPDDYRRGSLALGATKWQTLYQVVLPAAIPGIITGIILSVGRVISETAVFFVTLGGSHRLPTSIMDGGRTLALHLYYLAMDTNAFDKAMGTAAVLVTLIVLINLVIDIISRKLTAKVRGG
jgi:phosphate transport system permease protein